MFYSPLCNNNDNKNHIANHKSPTKGQLDKIIQTIEVMLLYNRHPLFTGEPITIHWA